jgi:hypothetical protein
MSLAFDGDPFGIIMKEKEEAKKYVANRGLPDEPIMPNSYEWIDPKTVEIAAKKLADHIDNEVLESFLDKKYDQGKPMVGLVKEDFPLAIMEVGKVAAYGIQKYNKRGSWKEVENGFNRYKDALGRHDLQSQYEDYDEESGLLHLAHLAWNALALLQFKLENLDDE